VKNQRLSVGSEANALFNGVLLVVTALLCAFLMMVFEKGPEEGLVEGQVASRNIRTHMDLSIPDAGATEDRRLEAENSVNPVYAYDAMSPVETVSRVTTAFENARAQIASAADGVISEGDDSVEPELLDQVASEFVAESQLTISPVEMAHLVSSGFPDHIQQSTVALYNQFSEGYIVLDSANLPRGGPISVRVVDASRLGENTVERENQLEDLSGIRSETSVRREIAAAMFDDQIETVDDPVSKRVVGHLAQSMVRGNFSYDLVETRRRQSEASAAVASVSVLIKEGVIVVRDGEVVNAEQARALELLRLSSAQRNPVLGFLALFGLVILVLGTFTSFARKLIRKFCPNPRDIVALAALLIFALVMARLGVELGMVTSSDRGVDLSNMAYFVPIAGVVLLVRILVNSETALIFSVVVSIFASLIFGAGVLVGTFFVFTGLVATSVIGPDSDRRAIIRAGVITGLTGALFVALSGAIESQMGGVAVGGGGVNFTSVGFAFVGGLAAGFLVLAMLPLFEMVGFVTNLQLLELANLSHPLLSNLLMRAPGSYHHSVMVGTLAEAAAKVVGCNSLLCRVASYYHDIGKAVSPHYFVENQRNGHSPHHSLPPETSAKVIIDHVKNGGEVAKRHKLPQPIIDNIYMHHGTGLLYFFYNQAKLENPNVKEEDFRYPGPKPNTREAGVIQLADKVEAACRSIKDPTPDKVAAMIEKIFSSTLADGQLEECPLTLKDLYAVADKFQEVVLAIHHQRIEYPETRSLSSGDLEKLQEGQDSSASKDEHVITLDLPPREAAELRARAMAENGETSSDSEGASDYESVDALPRERAFKSTPRKRR
jgi:cyclic-di-AMP phosphodiesterase PgpH